MKIIDEADIFSRAKEHKVVYKVTLNEEKIVLRIFTVKLRANMIYMEIDKLGLLRVVYVTRRLRESNNNRMQKHLFVCLILFPRKRNPIFGLRNISGGQIVEIKHNVPIISVTSPVL